jgi:hypothetical protein
MTTDTDPRVAAEIAAFQRHYGPSEFANDPLNPRREAFGHGFREGLAAKVPTAPVEAVPQALLEALRNGINNLATMSPMYDRKEYAIRLKQKITDWLATTPPHAEPSPTVELRPDIDSALRNLVQAAWIWGDSCGVDGVGWGQTGDSHNEWMHDKANLAAADLRNLFVEQSAETGRLTAELQEARKDAARLDWLLPNLHPATWGMEFEGGYDWASPAELLAKWRKSIDDELAAAPEAPKP